MGATQLAPSLTQPRCTRTAALMRGSVPPQDYCRRHRWPTPSRLSCRPPRAASLPRWSEIRVTDLDIAVVGQRRGDAKLLNLVARQRHRALPAPEFLLKRLGKRGVAQDSACRCHLLPHLLP